MATEPGEQQMTRRQHIVTRWYLDNFCDDKGWLFVYGRNREVRKSRPMNECLERDFYEYEISGRKTGNVYENWLGRIEGEAKGVLPLILGRQQLNRNQATIWSRFVASLFVRTRKARQQMSGSVANRFRTQTQRPEFVRDLQYRFLQAGELRYAEELQREMDSLLTAMEESPSFYHVVGIPRHTEVLAEDIMQRDWHTVYAPGGHVFVTSDCPVMTMERGERAWNLGAGFARPDTVIAVPITRDALFVASPQRFPWPPVLEPADVDWINGAVANFAQRNVYAPVHSDHLKELVDRQMNRTIFGENSFLLPGKN
jgi:hypothetical protein